MPRAGSGDTPRVIPVISPGAIYAVQEEKPRLCYEVLQALMDPASPVHGGEAYKGLIISRSYPGLLREARGFKDIPVYWLTTNVEVQEPVISPSAITRLNLTVTEFLRTVPRGAVLLDGLEYLITQNNFEILLRLFQSWNDRVMTSRSVILVPIDPLAIGKQELHLLHRESEDIFEADRPLSRMDVPRAENAR